MDVFKNYAKYYDLLYSDKEYKNESDYVISTIKNLNISAKNILELGCGTGGHAVHFARNGFDVVGVDLSEIMLQKARDRVGTEEESTGSKILFVEGDARNVRVGETYDSVVSLFHVMSYQTTDEDVTAAIRTAAEHLKPGGIFLFDAWYGPSVLKQQPSVRVANIENNNTKITRIAVPALHSEDNIVDIDYTIFIEDKHSDQIEKLTEKHRMRYFFTPEIKRFLQVGNFSLSYSRGWMSKQEPTLDTWGGCWVARKNG